MSTFAHNLRKLRKDRKLSMDSLAEKAGTSKQVLSRYENDERVPKISMVKRLADALGVSVSELSGEDDVNQDETEAKLWAKREALRRDPKRKMLFDLAENGTEKDIDAAAALIDALRATNPDFYDGDDPS